MNATIRRARLLGLASLAALGVLALPSSALAGKAHLVTVYKVEKHVDIQGSDDTYSVPCHSKSDIVLDGMWRIDNVDQDNDWDQPANYPLGSPVGLAIQNSLRARSAEADKQPGSAVSDPKNDYTFAFDSTAGGDTQIKLWVTCLPNPSPGIGHSNPWIVSGPATTTGSTAAIAGFPLGTEVGQTATCPANQIVIAPSFTVTSGDPDLVLSYPGSPSSPNLRTWKWAWYAPAAATISHDASCLQLRSGPASSGPPHVHRLVVNFVHTTTSAANHGVKHQTIMERQRSCGELYKAVVGAFDIRSAWDNVNGWMRTYFLGMDPRIKTRAYKFVNLSSSDSAVDVGAVCFKDKTT
jgi:hypothetical protein